MILVLSAALSVEPVGGDAATDVGRGARRACRLDFEGKNAQFTNPQITAATMAWATKILVV